MTKTECTIRSMTEADLAAVQAIEADSQAHPWSRQHFSDELLNRFSTIDLCVCGDRIAGFVCSWLIAGELQIQNVAVAPEFRRQGIALQLLDHVLVRCCQQGLERAWLEVRGSNLAAIRLYEKYGFQTMDRRAGYYHDGEDALVMSYIPDGVECQPSFQEKRRS